MGKRAKKKIVRESGRARTIRLALETPPCDCGEPTVYEIRKFGKTYRWCCAAHNPFRTF
jgi:hypothetical protein